MKLSISVAFAGLVGLAGLGPVGCGGVKHATRPDSGPEAKDPSLVEVRTTGYDGPTKVVSYSTWDVDPNDELPASVPDDVVADMREQAAAYGADMLLLDRIDDSWRKVWLGLGVKKDASANPTAAVPPCVHNGFDAAREDARQRAIRCVKGVLYEREALRGSIDVLFEVDPEGRVLRAAPSPDSSRDSSFQQCVVGAVHGTSFGRPLGFTCQGRVAVKIAGPGAVE